MNNIERPRKTTILAEFAEILSFVLNVGGIVFPLFGWWVLKEQPTPPVIPGVEISLGTWFQLLLLFSSFFGYLHFLRKYWERNQRREDFDTRFWYFLISDMTVKKPLFMIGFVLILGTTVFVSYWSILFLIAISTIIGLYPDEYLSLPNEAEYKWNRDKVYREGWIKRINRALDENNNEISTKTFDNYGFNKYKDYEEINKALRLYYYTFENVKDLKITPDESQIDYNFWKSVTLISSKKHIPLA